MLGPIPFEVPAYYAAKLHSGTLIRAGALLKDSASGRIVAHLQETGLAQNLISSAISSPFSPISALSSVAANAQLVQIKAMIEGLQILQFVNLGATIAGIGVSAIGFALMNKKLNGLQATVDSLIARVEARFKDLQARELRSHYSKVNGLFNQADQAHFLTNASGEWGRIAGMLADESAYFRGELVYLLQQESFNRQLFEPLTQSYALCNAGRIECLVLSQELQAAHKVAQDVAIDCNRMFDPLNPTALARKSTILADHNEKPYDHLLQQELVGMQELVSNIRDTQDAALSKPYLLETMIEREIDGYQYLRQVREEKERPLLLLQAS